MTTSTILPPSPSKPAEIAASSASEAGGATDMASADGAPSFGQVLKSQIEKSGGERSATERIADAKSTPAEGAEVPEENVVVGETPAAALIGLISAGQDARRIPNDVSTLAARTMTDAVPGQDTADTDHRGGVGLHARSTTAGRGAMVDTDRGARKAAQLADSTAHDDIGELAAPRHGRPLMRALSADGASFEKAVTSALSTADIPTTIVPTTGSAEVRKAPDPGALRLTVAQPVAATGWDEAVADRVTWLTQARQPSAELHLNPPNLGPVEVHVSTHGDQTTVSFFSPHAPVREALQAATPRLAEAFAAAGLSLGNVSVGADSRSGQDADRRDQGRQRRPAESASVVASVGAGGRWTSSLGGTRAVDLFA